MWLYKKYEITNVVIWLVYGLSQKGEDLVEVMAHTSTKEVYMKYKNHTLSQEQRWHKCLKLSAPVVCRSFKSKPRGASSRS